MTLRLILIFESALLPRLLILSSLTILAFGLSQATLEMDTFALSRRREPDAPTKAAGGRLMCLRRVCADVMIDLYLAMTDRAVVRALPYKDQ